MVERRKFLVAGTVGGAAMLLPHGVQRVRAYTSTDRKKESTDTTVPQTPPLEKYVDPLPRPVTAIPDPYVYPGADYYEITMLQYQWQFHRDLGKAAVWGYWAMNPRDPDKPIGMGYLGPTINATKDHPTVIMYRNELPTTHLFQSAVDLIHQGDTEIIAPPYHGEPTVPPNVNVWNVVHQHGGLTPPQSDGLPKQSFSPEGVHAVSYATLDPSRAGPLPRHP
jgi:spore coat protein A, manganese oxidase